MREKKIVWFIKTPCIKKSKRQTEIFSSSRCFFFYTHKKIFLPQLCRPTKIRSLIDGHFCVLYFTLIERLVQAQHQTAQKLALIQKKLIR